MKTLTLVLAASCFLLLARPVEAATCPGPTPTIAALDANTRLQFLNAKLRREYKTTYTWTEVIQVVYGFGTLGQVAYASVAPINDRPDYWIGAGNTVIGNIVLAAFPLEVMNDGPKISDAPVNAQDAEVCRVLANAEAMFLRDAESEAFNRSILAHVSDLVINLAFALWLGFGYHHWESAAINFGISMVIGEAMIFTTPNHLNEEWKQYQGGRLN